MDRKLQNKIQHENVKERKFLRRKITQYNGFVWQGLGSGGYYRGGFCEKLLEAFPLSSGANVSQLQDEATAGQAQAHQRRW